MWYFVVLQPSKCNKTHFQPQIWSIWPIFPNDSESLPKFCNIKQKNSEILSKLRNSEPVEVSASITSKSQKKFRIGSQVRYWLGLSSYFPSYYLLTPNLHSIPPGAISIWHRRQGGRGWSKTRPWVALSYENVHLPKRFLILQQCIGGGMGGNRGLLCSIQSKVFILTHLFLPQLL